MFRKEKPVDEFDGGEKGTTLDPTTSVGNGAQVVAHDDVFGELTDDGPNYRAVSLQR